MNESVLYDISSLQLEQEFTFAFEISADEAEKFLQLTCDNNPLHWSESFSKRTTMNRKNLAGQHLVSRCIGFVGTDVPGPGWSCLSVESKFIKPAFADTSYILKLRLNKVSVAVKTASWEGNVLDSSGEKIALIKILTQYIL